MSDGQPLGDRWPAIVVALKEAECFPLLYKQGFWLRVEASASMGPWPR